MKEVDNNIQILLNEFSNITVEIKVKVTYSDDFHTPIVENPIMEMDDESEDPIIVGFIKLWDFLLTFNREFIVESDNIKYLKQKAIPDYRKFIEREKSSAYKELDDFIISEKSLFEKRNYLSSLNLRFKELLKDYKYISDDKRSQFYKIIDNENIIRSISEEKLVNELFEKNFVHSFLIVQKDTIQSLILFIDDKLSILSNIENIHRGDPQKSEQKTSVPMPPIDLIQDLSTNIVIRSFLWKRGKDFKRDILILYQLLKQSKIISHETDFNDFIYAFSGNPLIKPLRIKWLIIGKNKQTSKSSLFYFISRLEDLKLIDNREWIEKNYAPLYKKVSIIFSDKDGNIFKTKGLKSSMFQGMRSNCAKQLEIDKIVNLVSKPNTDTHPE